MYAEPPAEPRKAARADILVAFRNILAFENFVLLMGVIFCLQLVDRSFGPMLPLHLDNLGYGSVSLLSGVLFSVLALSGALGHQLAAMLLKRMSRADGHCGGRARRCRRVRAPLRPAPRCGLLVPAMALIGLSLGTALTAAFSAAGAVIPTTRTASSFGFLTSASLIGSAISPVLSGLVGVHSFRVVFVGGAIILGVLALAVRRVMVDRNLQIE